MRRVGKHHRQPRYLQRQRVEGDDHKHGIDQSEAAARPHAWRRAATRPIERSAGRVVVNVAWGRGRAGATVMSNLQW